MALSLLDKLKVRAGEAITTPDPTNPDPISEKNQAIIDRYKNVPGVNVEKLTEYVNLNIPEPQTIVHAMLLAEAIGYTPEQAKVVGAQWAVESGRGVSTAGADYNYFGVKSHNDAVMKRMSEQYGIDVSQGDVVKTVEYINGKRKVIEDTFASFNNPIEGFLGKKAFLETNKRYKEALNPENTADEFAQGLKDAGYATDPVYASKLANIYNGPMRTSRPSWMEPTRKSNVPQSEWNMTAVQPTEDSRTKLVEKKETGKKEALPLVPKPTIPFKRTEFKPPSSEFSINPLPDYFTGEEYIPTVSDIETDIKYKPQEPRFETIIGGTLDERVENYMQAKSDYEQAMINQAAKEENIIYNKDPQKFNSYETLTLENLPEVQLPEVTISGNKQEETIPQEEEVIPLEKPVQPEINMEYLDSIPDVNSFIVPGSFTNESRSKEELKADAAAEEFIMNPLEKKINSGFFGSGKSLFYPSTRQNRNGGAMVPNIPVYYNSKGTPIYRDTTSLPFEAGGSINIKPENKGKFTAKANAAGMGVQAFANKVLGASKGTYSPSTRRQANFARNASKWNRGGGILYPRYFNNGGDGDGEQKPTNPIVTNKGLLEMLNSLGKHTVARASSKIELPEQGDMSDYEYFSSLTYPQQLAIRNKEAMALRDKQSEAAHVNQVRENMINIAEKLAAEESGMKEDFEYLDIPWMGQVKHKERIDEYGNSTMIVDPSSSWFHKIPSKDYTGYQTITKDDSGNETVQDVLDPYTCIGTYCAIGRKAGARMTEDSKHGQEGDLWPVLTGNYLVDDAGKTMGLYEKPAFDMQIGDAIRTSYYDPNNPTNHTMMVTGEPVQKSWGVRVPTTYGNHWSAGVYTDTFYDPEDLGDPDQFLTSERSADEYDALIRYEGKLPEYIKNLEKAQDLATRFRNYKQESAISPLPLIKQELSYPSRKLVLNTTGREYPNTRKGRKQKERDDAYIQAYLDKMQKK